MGEFLDKLAALDRDLLKILIKKNLRLTVSQLYSKSKADYLGVNNV
jgi:hypothetical protein